jgi:hypothetical protein
LNIAQPKYKAQDQSMVRVLLEVTTPLSTTVNFSNQTLIFAYQKLKMIKRVEQDKHHKRHKFKRLFLFDFFDTKTKFKTPQTFKNLKAHSNSNLRHLNSKTLSKTKLSRKTKPNQTKLEAKG